MNTYFKKINFNFEPEPIMEIADKYLDNATDGFKDSNGNYTTYASVGQVMEANGTSVTSLYLRDLPVDFTNLKVLHDCVELFKNTPKHNNFDHVYKYAQFFKIKGPLPPHVDKRTCVFTIPLYGVDRPVYWFDDNNQVLEKYTYDGPSIINTSIKHGCMENEGERVFFQIGGFSEPFEEIANLL